MLLLFSDTFESATIYLFFAFLDDLGNFKHFEPNSFFFVFLLIFKSITNKSTFVTSLYKFTAVVCYILHLCTTLLHMYVLITILITNSTFPSLLWPLECLFGHFHEHLGALLWNVNISNKFMGIWKKKMTCMWIMQIIQSKSIFSSYCI